jgi:AAA family ATP:ADP antiporter
MNAVQKILRDLFEIEPGERIKIFLLGLIFFLVIGAYTITRDLKSSIFISVVGREYVPWAKVITMLLLVPLIFLYSRAVDAMRRYQLLAVYSAVFSIGGFIFAYLLGHPEYGLLNTASSPYRIWGWVFFLFGEAYSPFVVSVFWAFANSIMSPEGAKKNYGFIVSGSKLGGMLTSGLAWYLFAMSGKSDNALFSDVGIHQIFLAVSSAMLLLVPFAIWMLIRMVPASHLHGYEAAYQQENSQKEKQKEKSDMFAGLSMFIKYPYVLGIFGLVFFYEVISTVLSFLRLGVAEANAHSISDVSSLLFEMAFKTHVIGFLVSFLGTRTICQRLGTTFCLVLVPLLTGFFLLYLMIETTPEALVNAFVFFKAVHYAFSWPVRETLYIPTIKEIKFKSRSWIDAFGSKIARTTGSAFNIISADLGAGMILPIHSFFFASIIGIWLLVGLLLGKRFERAVKKNEVIGS